MKTLTNVVYIQELANGQRMERTESFIRGGSAKKPTYSGASRMIASRLNHDNDSHGEFALVKPSQISVSRIEFCDYQSR